MHRDTTAAVCACCLDGEPCGTVPSGVLKNRPACDACLRAIAESLPGRPRDLVDLRIASPAFECAVFAVAEGRALRALLEELPRELDHGEVRAVSLLPDRGLVAIWHSLGCARMPELLAGLREAAGYAGVDLRIAPALVQTERREEARPAAQSAGAS